MHRLKVEIEDSDTSLPSTKKVKVAGELDMATAPQLSAALDRLADDGLQVLLVDAAEVDFLDSSGVRALVIAANRLEGVGGSLRLERMSPAVQRVLEITGLAERYSGDGRQPA